MFAIVAGCVAPPRLVPPPIRSNASPVVALAPVAAGALESDALKCEFSTNPLGIDTAHPRLFWQVTSATRGERQTAWQILTASSADALARGRGDLWDSGRVASDQTGFVPYAGAPLASSEQVFWKVRVWDGEGRASAWSAPATWTMGLLTPADWKGVWITAPGATESLLLRDEFTVRPGLRRAIVNVCGLGNYELRFNGAKAGEDLLAPGWTNYDKTALYATKDVTAMLHAGRNAVGLVLGNGMYNVVLRNRFTKFTGSFGPLRAILSLRLEYADGAVDYVGTSENWRTRAGPEIFNSIYGGEDCDARLAPAGWDEPGFNPHGWSQAVTMVRPRGALRGHSADDQPLRAIAVLEPVAVKTFPDGSAVYDFGQNAAAMPRIRVTGPAGSTVRLTPAEVVNPDGTINRSTMGGTGRGSSWWQYTKSTDGEETWFPRFFYCGFRYLKVGFFPPTADGPPSESANPPSSAGADPARLPRLAGIEDVIVHSSAPPVGDFSTSNDLLNRIRALVRWAQESNMVSVLTDCPHREKLGWLEQYHLNGPAIRYEFGVNRIFTKGMDDMAGAQTDDGLIPTTAPEFAKFKGAFRAATEWGSAFIIVPWQQYHFTGDLGPLRAHYGAMKRYLAYLETRATDGIVSEGLGDWYDLGPKRPGFAQLTPPPVTATAFYYYDAKILAQAAALLGHDADAKAFAARATAIRADYNRHFYHADGGYYATDSQCANALPLVLGIVAPENRARVFAALVRDVEKHGDEMTAGDVGFRFLLQALAQGGRSDLVYGMIDQTDRPGYGYQLAKGATSLCESWDANLNSSHDHFMLGQITEWFYRDLAGIDFDPAAPGFKHILLHPQPVGDLKWVAATYDSIHGPISVHWEHADGRFTLQVSIPANTTATVWLPARAGAPILEGGAPTEHRPGVTLLRREGDRAVFAIESGRYKFESVW